MRIQEASLKQVIFNINKPWDNSVRPPAACCQSSQASLSEGLKLLGKPLPGVQRCYNNNKKHLKIELRYNYCHLQIVHILYAVQLLFQ